MSAKFPKLFEPIKINTMTVRNRIAMPAMGTNYASDEGFVTERLKNYYEARAKGGVGLIIVEIAGVDFPTSKALANQVAADNDRFIPGLKDLAQAIQRHGAKACLQLHHAGRETSNTTAKLAVGASPIRGHRRRVPRELTIPEIKAIVNKFGDAAYRAKQAGFDAIEIHGAHYYFINQFLSPASNQRNDIYGGDITNRARLLVEILQNIRARVGPDFPVICRINGAEYGVEGGILYDDFLTTARLSEQNGADALHVSAFGIGTEAQKGLVVYEPGFLTPFATAAKKVVKVPVITVGRIGPELAEKILEEGRADMVAMGRQVLADPELPNKAAAGQLEEIVPCIACLECVDRVTFTETPIECSTNPALGRERERAIKKAPKAKKVLVAGGGPAGMEAALVAKLRGHEVVLYEKSKELGGRLIPAAKPPFKEDYVNLIDYLKRQLKKHKVNVHLGEAVTPETIDEIKPDALIVAVGSEPVIPPIPGIDKISVATADDVLTGKAQTGNKVVIIGGGMIGCETAEYLAGKGKTVSIVEIADVLAGDKTPLIKIPLIDRLRKCNVKALLAVKPVEITKNCLKVKDREGKDQNIEADTFVVAVGSKPDTGAFQTLSGKIPEVYFAGDCVKTRGVLEATEEGFIAASRI